MGSWDSVCPCQKASISTAARHFAMLSAEVERWARRRYRGRTTQPAAFHTHRARSACKVLEFAERSRANFGCYCSTCPQCVQRDVLFRSTVMTCQWKADRVWELRVAANSIPLALVALAAGLFINARRRNNDGGILHLTAFPLRSRIPRAKQPTRQMLSLLITQ